MASQWEGEIEFIETGRGVSCSLGLLGWGQLLGAGAGGLEAEAERERLGND